MKRKSKFNAKQKRLVKQREDAILAGKMQNPLNGNAEGSSEPISSGFTPAMIISLLKETAEGKSIDTFMALAEELEEKDSTYRSLLQNRKLAVFGIQRQVIESEANPNSKEHADLIREFMSSGIVQPAIMDMLDSIGKSVSVSKIDWDYGKDKWLPKKITYINPSKFNFTKKEIRLKVVNQQGVAQTLTENAYIVHRSSTKSGDDIRGGLTRSAAMLIIIKLIAIKDWLSYVELYGSPLRLGTYDDAEDPENVKKLKKAISSIGHNASAVLPSSMDIKLLGDQKAGDGAAFQNIISYVDEQLSRLVLGQTLTSSVGSSGSYAAATVHLSVLDQIIMGDSEQLCATLNRQLIKPIIDFNFGEQDGYPVLKSIQTETPNEKSKLAGEIAVALNRVKGLGIKVSKSDVIRKLGLVEPIDESDALDIDAIVNPVDVASQDHSGCQACLGSASMDGNSTIEKDQIDVDNDILMDEYEEMDITETLADELEKAKSPEEMKIAIANLIASSDISNLVKIIKASALTANIKTKE